MNVRTNTLPRLIYKDSTLQMQQSHNPPRLRIYCRHVTTVGFANLRHVSKGVRMVVWKQKSNQA